MLKTVDKPIEQLYQETVANAGIPATTDQQELQNKYLVRDLVVSLDEVMRYVAIDPARYSQVQIYTDILRISQETRLDKITLLLVARKIEVAGTCMVQLSEESQGIMLFAQELTGALQFVHADQPGNVAWTLDQLPSDGVGLEIYAEESQIKHEVTKRIKNDMIQWLRPTRLLLTAQFQVAAALFNTHPTEAQALLRWLVFLSKGVTEASDLHGQSEALLTRLLLASSTTTFVPYLSLGAYEREAHALFAPIKAYEAQYERFLDKNTTLKDRQTAVSLMLQQNAATIEAHRQLITLAEQTLTQSLTNAEQAQEKYKDQQYQVKLAKIEFEFGMEKWKIEQYWAAIRGMFIAAGNFAISLATAVATGGGSAAEAIASGLSALQEMGKLVGQTNAVYRQMQALLTSMERLAALVEDLEVLIKSLCDITQNGQDREVELPDLTAPNLDLISGQAEWDVFIATMETLLQQALNEPIEGAPEYKLESEKLAIYGKAFLACQAATIRAGQELLQLQVQAQVSQGQQQPLEAYLQMLEEQEELHAAVMQLLFQQQLNLKCWLFLALQNLVWAYHYETLTSGEVIPPITATVLQLEEALAALVRKHNTIRENLNPPPQSAQTRQLITTVEIPHSAYEGVLATLQQKREATITIPLDEFTMRGLERVRVTRWRCILQGVPIPAGRRISLTLESSGIHTDRWQGTTYQFAAAPSKRKFVYENAHPDMDGISTITDEVLNVEHAIMVDGEVAEEEKTNYYRPTPFTQWTIRLDDTEQIIDLSTLQSLRLIWFMDAIITNPTR